MKSRLPNQIFWFIYGVTLASSESGISLHLRGKRIPNHGHVNGMDIGESELDSLWCKTDLLKCCEKENLGVWNYPNYEPVTTESGGRHFFVTRGRQVLRLHLRRTLAKEGMYRCHLPDARGFPDNRIAVVGIYRSGNGLPEIYSLSFDQRTLTINCYSQGGPVTEFSWTRNDEHSPLQNGLEYLQSKAVFDYSMAKYLITLKATKARDIIGTFNCAVQNSAGFNQRKIVIQSNFSSRVVKGCGSLAHVKNGQVNLSSGFDIGSKITYTCAGTHRLAGSSQGKCIDTGRTGDWVGINPQCIQNRACKQGIDYVFNSYVRYSDGYNEFSKATFSCKSGYYLLSSKKVVCKNGRWEGNPPLCVKVVCNRLPEFGKLNPYRIDYESIQIGAIAIYHCHPAELQIGTPEQKICTLIRNRDARWIGKDPVCKRNGTCIRNLKAKPHVLVQYTNLQAVFKCDKGYILKGQPYVECDTETNQWKKFNMPLCAGAQQHLHFNFGSYNFMILWVLVTNALNY